MTASKSRHTQTPQPAFQFNWLELPDKHRLVAQAMMFQFSQTEKFSSEQLAQLQLASLKNLMRHCLDHVPYYQSKGYFSVDSWEDWRRLPLLTRKAVQQNADALHSKLDLRSRDGRTAKKRTSGSTGRPLEVTVTERAQVYWSANTVRDHLWQRRDFSRHLAVIKYTGQEGLAPPGKTSQHWGSSTGLLYTTGKASTISSSTDVDAQFRWLQKLQPGYLLTYPSLLQALARCNLTSDRPLRLSGITTIGETLNPQTRRLAQEAFGCRVADIYSCQELGYMALQCPVYDHYHLMAETCLVEILDDNNRACPPGEMGRVVVTHLHNHTMPLVRYDIGDYAIAGSSCDCGIGLPVVERIIGRSRNLVTYPDGRRSWPLTNSMAMLDVLPDAQFQVVQKSVDTLLLRIGSDLPVTEAIQRELTGILHKAIGYPFKMEYEQVTCIPRSASGKFEEFLSELAPR